MIESIVHPTDLSPDGELAFEHALRLAMVNRCNFTLLHVRDSEAGDDWDSFPRVRETLERWGVLEPGSHQRDVHAKTGVNVSKYEIRGEDPVDGLAGYLELHHVDLIVMASRGRAGLGRMLNGSVSARLAQVSMVPTLIFGPDARSFVDERTGSLERIRTVLVPVDNDPAPHAAIRRLDALAEGLDVRFDYLHVGEDAPVIMDGEGRPRPVRTVEGPVVETLLTEAAAADLVAMPMVGRQGLLDALRGSTTERVVSEVRCPVLAIPAGS